MCGRYTLTNPEGLAERFDVAVSQLELDPRYNVAPSQSVPVITAQGGQPAVELMEWGFRFGPKQGAPQPINARAETLAEKPAFKSALARRRCLIPADGFYEWQAQGRSKQPYYFRPASGDLFAFAGLYSAPQGMELGGSTIITTEPNALVAPIHNRMPVIVRRDLEELWLDPEVQDAGVLAQCLRSYPAEEMEGYPVGAAVSSPRTNGPELVRPLAGA